VTTPNFDIAPAPEGSWRDYDRENPDPFYYDFDSLSARHPDLYHRFALSSVGAMEELRKVIDVSGLDVVDVGAGTGRATQAAAQIARHVYAVDAFASVVSYGSRLAQDAGLTNVDYLRGDRSKLPVEDATADAVIASMAGLDAREAARVLKPGGYIVSLGLQQPWFAGELTSALVGPTLPEIDADSPAVDSKSDEKDWDGVATVDGIHHHDSAYRASYESVDEAAAIIGRLMGPACASYLLERNQATVLWALRITWARVASEGDTSE
jgi:ubiquinone/menaquinone biosynthesis C-methylase UbiE